MQNMQRGKCHQGSGLLISAVAPTASGHVPWGRAQSLPGPDPALHRDNRVYPHNKAAHCPRLVFPGRPVNSLLCSTDAPCADVAEDMIFLLKKTAEFSTNSSTLCWDKADTLRGCFCKKK